MSDQPDVPMTPVTSTNIASVGTSGRDLLVLYQSGKTYRFVGKAEHAADVLASNSPGSYIFRHFGRSGIEE